MNGTNCTNCTTFHCNIPPVLQGIPSYVNYLQGAIILCVAALSFALNGFTIFLILRHKILHHRTFYLALHTCIINLVFTAIIHITSIISAFSGGWLLGDITCQIVGFFHDTLVSARFLFALVLAADRLMTVFLPFWYRRHGGKTALGMLTALWIWSLFRGILPLEGVLNCYAYIPTIKSCSIAFSCSDQCYKFGIFAITFLHTMSNLFPFFLYIVLFRKGRQIQKQLLGVRQMSERIWYQHNWRAIVTFLLLFIVLIGCGLPPLILFLAFQIELAVVGRPSVAITVLQLFIGRILFLSLSAIDPIVILRNRDVREVLKRTIQRHVTSNYHYTSRPSTTAFGDNQNIFTSSETKRSMTIISHCRNGSQDAGDCTEFQ